MSRNNIPDIIKFDSNSDMIPGTRHSTTRSGDLLIVEYINCSSVTVKFVNTGTVLTEITSDNIRRGNVGDPFAKTHYGVGYMGIGPYTSRSHIRAYTCWSNLIARVHTSQDRNLINNYSDCSIYPDWYNYQIFAHWHNRQKFSMDDGYELDKDLIVEGNRIYGPETCLFIPKLLNSILSTKKGGMYLPGVARRTVSGKFEGKISIDGRNKYLGIFSSQEEAYQVYLLENNKRILKVSEALYSQGRIDLFIFELVKRRFNV